MPPQIDPQVKALVSAIGQAETGPTSPAAYTQKGKSGEFGRYQFMPDTYKAYAGKYLNDANAQPTVENQNKIAYSFVKEKKDAGFNPAQIASMWNAGEAKPNAYKENYRGVNSQGVAYDTPAYAAKVSKYYEQQKAALGQGTVNGPMDVAPQQGNNFITDLGNTLKEGGTGVIQGANKALSGAMSGNAVGTFNGLLQGAGAGASILGGATNNVLEHLPVIGDAYKGVEGLIGKGVQAAANTGTGQQLIGNYQQWAAQHPETAADIGAGVNIATAIPLFKGLGLAKTAAKDAVTGALSKNFTEKAANEIRAAVTTKTATKGLVSAEKRGLDPVKTVLSDKQYMPDVVAKDGKFVYNIDKPSTALKASLDGDEEALQAMLKQAVKKNVGVDLEQVRSKVLKDVAKEYSMSGNYRPAVKAVNDYFDSFAESTGGRKVIDLNELNGIKRDVRGAIFDVGGDVKGTAAASIKYQIGQSLMKQVEEIAKKVGVKGVKELNKTMAGKIEALKLLESIAGKSAKTGGAMGREILTDVAGAAGEGLGNMVGLPFASTFAGRGLAGLIGRRLPRTSVQRLKTAAPVRSTLKKAALNTAVGLTPQVANTQR